MKSPLSERDAAEVRRSAAEASKTHIKTVDLQRYMNPPADTVFGLEYAYHLLGDVRGKTVLDLGCGSGENLVPLSMRGASVIGIDISPELIEVARTRLQIAGREASLKVASAYDTGLADSSVDVIFCMALVHHLNIPAARDEMRRILLPGGRVIFKEPIRFSSFYARLRSHLPSHGDNSEYEHPLSRDEMVAFTQGFRVERVRYFRLPFIPLVKGITGAVPRWAWRASDRCLRNVKFLEPLATGAVGSMVRV